MNEKDQILKLFSHPVFKFKVKDYKNINSNLLKYIYDLQKKIPLVLKNLISTDGILKPSDLSDLENSLTNFLNQ